MIATAQRPNRTSPPAARLDAPWLGARRAFFFSLVLLTTAYGVSMMAALVSGGGTTRLELIILVLFTPTFAWISVAFWNAAVGFTLKALGRNPLTLERVGAPEGVALHEPLASRTALVVPARNEDADAVVRRIEAMLASLEGSGQAGAFDVHLLSDTDDPERIPSEETAWSGLLGRYSGPVGLHYRRRAANEGRKAGNIGEFLGRAGSGYEYMVVLDADSVMSSDTLVRLVRTMDANPRAGLVQTVPLPGPQATRFGRFIELAAGLYGPMLAAGQSFWQGDAANYWGHNAIVRVEPFVRHCRLPVLRGTPPLGGEILSHDFVEAALLRRAGWGVYLLEEAGGSWEDVPGNLIDYARRDRRWCQGSLQHLKLLALRGLHPVSRLHFLLGAMGYVSSLLWLLLLLASTAYVAGIAASGDPALNGIAGLGSWTLVQPLPSLLAVTAAILFLPKGLGLLLALPRRERYGGAARLFGVGVAEAGFAAVVAPVMMMYHAKFVSEVIVGHSVGWSVQSREGASLTWRDATMATGWISAGGLLWAVGTWSLSPLFFAWMAPIFVGLLAAIPLVRWTSRPSVGVFDFGPTDDRVLLSRISGTAVERGGSVNDMHEAERGLFELRRRRALLVTHSGNGDGTVGGDALVASAEGLAEEMLTSLRRLADGPLHLVVTQHRARALGIQLAAGPLALRLPAAVGPGDVLHLCSGRGSTPPHGMTVRPATVAEAQGLALARLAQLLPAVVTGEVSATPRAELTEILASRGILRVDSARIRTALEAPRVAVSQVSEAPVPLQDAEDARFVLFREDNALLEHVAIMIGRREAWPDPVPVRLHSACLTGDLFGSLKCDCGEQLRGSLRHFQEGGGGVLLYLQQEGRGIGLGNKLRAYSLQDGGLDTIDADCTLGFGPDERTYDAALEMLHQLSIDRVQLLTNNPDKLRAVERGGIQVLDRMPLHGTLNRFNLPYVEAKVQRAGHWLGDMLSGVSGNGS